uniref:Coiled-coil domain-containing protein 157 n=1 Tax=Dicentrarchus labrax TaxID=13489 RepID=A0A8P4G815_DICLA
MTPPPTTDSFLLLLSCIQSMQAKQTSLLKRVDALDEECEELQRQLGEREERQIDLHNQLQQVSEEKEKVQARLAQQQLQKEKQTLETHVGELKNSVAELKEYVQTLMERERVLVAFPELSPLQAQPQSTGNVLLDMERQLQANNIRMKVLEQENITLHTSLVKLRERTQNDAGRTEQQEGSKTGGKWSGVSWVGGSRVHRRRLPLVHATSPSNPPPQLGLRRC